MQFVNCDYTTFVNRVQNKKIVLFGVSSGWNFHLSVLPTLDKDVLDKVLFVVDNDPEKIGKSCNILGRGFAVKNPKILCEFDNIVVLITVRFRYCEKICDQLVSYKLSDKMECYSLQLLYSSRDNVDNGCVEKYFNKHTKMCIPKKIHSFWFSEEEKPDLYKKCIESWYKYCPDYEICEWNMYNYNIEKNVYMKQALEKRKWAFASDYARLDIIYEQGGIYFDMDVELLAPIDFLRSAKGFFCKQDDGMVDFGSGFGAPQGSPFLKKLLKEYNGLQFYNEEGEMDLLPQPARLGHVFSEHGLEIGHHSEVLDDMIVLSNSYITCPNWDECQLSGKELGIHWHNGGWRNSAEKAGLTMDANGRKAIERKFFKFAARGATSHE